MEKKIYDKIENLISGRKMKESITFLLNLEDFSVVFELADKITNMHKGKFIDIRGIIEFSNVCTRKCKYCGINLENNKVKRYRMSKEEIIKICTEAVNAGYKTIVMQSGEDNFFNVEKLGEIVREIKLRHSVAITLSCGEKSYSELRYLKKSGVDRYLLKHETSSNYLYSSLHPCGNLVNRIKCLKNIYELGYEVGSGFMIGLPKQTIENIASDLILLKKLKCHMAGIGPFIPHPDTDLKNMDMGSVDLTRRAISLARILLPYSNLPATTSLSVAEKNKSSFIFSAGANIIMKKITPIKYAKHYEIYPSEVIQDNVYEERRKVEEYVRKIGKIPI